MCHKLLKCTAGLHVTMVILALGMGGPAFAVDHFWTGAVSTDAADPLNWDNGTANPTLPSDNDIVRVGCTPDWQLVELANSPVLTSEWNSRAGTAGAGWWLLMGSSENSITIGDGAYIEWSHNDCTIRNGSTVRVTGQRAGGGPSLVITPRFRVGNNGDNVPTATGAIIVEKNGYLRLDPGVSRKGSGGWQIYMGPATKALVEIRDNGIFELVQNADGTVIPRFVFASADPAANKIVISGKGQLLLTGDPTAIATVADEDTSLQSLIDMGLIAAANEDETLVYSGMNPTVVKLAGQRVSNPSPTDGAIDTDRYTVLSWDPGTMTDKYDVYLGADAADVAGATRANPLGCLRSRGQAETRYPPDDMLILEYGRTYYWRLDEVDVAPDQAILKGKIWSFTVEPFVIPIPAQNITATASSQSPDQGPEKTIDGSGLDANDLHSSVLVDMWLSDTGTPVWIEYEFDKAYKIRRMLVWNYNGEEILTKLGLKDVAIEYATDGGDWTMLAGVPVFEEAPGMPGYAANTIVDFGDVSVKKIRITANNNWGNHPMFNQYGLSEVRFMHVPVAARQPSPASGQTDVAIDAVLSWRAGREAAEHDVYLSSDPQAMADGDVLPETVYQASYSPPSLDLGTTYYWRVDEVNDAEAPAIWPGDLWTFATADCVVVDDFESYTDDVEAEQTIWQAWSDGLADPQNGGSQVGYNEAPFAEQAIVHGGRQSMPLAYNSSASAFSQAVRTFDGPQNWTRGGITTLVLFFQGESTNVSGELYVKINGVRVPYSGSAGDLTMAEWNQWTIDLPVAAGLGAVQSLTIGVSGGQGMLYIDDIGLYRSAPAVNP